MKRVLPALAAVAVLAALACLWFGHGLVATLLFVAGGIGFGIALPPEATSTSDTHGASDSTD
jgi:hypothetical protein